MAAHFVENGPRDDMTAVLVEEAVAFDDQIPHLVVEVTGKPIPHLKADKTVFYLVAEERRIAMVIALELQASQPHLWERCVRESQALSGCHSNKF